MAYLSKEDLILKLTPFGVKSVSSLNRLIREQYLPAKYLTSRKVFFEEAEIDVWLSRRSESVTKANTTRIKVQRSQRKARKDAKEKADAVSVEVKPFKKSEA